MPLRVRKRLRNKFRRGFKKSLEKQYLESYRTRTLTGQRNLALDWNGKPVTRNELNFYASSSCVIHDEAVDPARLRCHIMRPRAYPPKPIVDFYRAREILGAFLASVATQFGVPVSLCCISPVVFVIGTLPFENDVLYHGTNLNSLRSLLSHGLKPMRCGRKGWERNRFGRKLFSTFTLEQASNWSQYCDVGILASNNKADHINWFANCVAIIPDRDFKLSVGVFSKRVWPPAYLVELLEETDLLAFGRYIGPHFGNFCAKLNK